MSTTENKLKNIQQSLSIIWDYSNEIFGDFSIKALPTLVPLPSSISVYIALQPVFGTFAALVIAAVLEGFGYAAVENAYKAWAHNNSVTAQEDKVPSKISYILCFVFLVIAEFVIYVAKSQGHELWSVHTIPLLFPPLSLISAVLMANKRLVSKKESEMNERSAQESAKEKLSIEIDGLRSQLEESSIQIVNLTNDHQKEIDTLNHHIDGLTINHQAAIDTLIVNHKKEIDDLTVNFNRQIDTLNRQLESSIVNRQSSIVNPESVNLGEHVPRTDELTPKTINLAPETDDIGSQSSNPKVSIINHQSSIDDSESVNGGDSNTRKVSIDDRRQMVLTAIIDDPKVSVSAIMKRTGASRNTVNNDIKALGYGKIDGLWQSVGMEIPTLPHNRVAELAMNGAHG